MGKLRKQRKGKKFNYDVNRKKAWKKSKKLPTIQCPQIKNAWDSRKSMRRNLEEMGISADPNQTLKIPKTKDFLKNEGSEQEADRKQTPKSQPKKFVVQDLEAEANAPLEKTLRLSSEEVKYCIYMMEKYDEDFKAMARDRRNYYQDTPKQIKKKIKTFMNIPEQYNAYLASKASTSDVCESFNSSHLKELIFNQHVTNEPPLLEPGNLSAKPDTRVPLIAPVPLDLPASVDSSVRTCGQRTLTPAECTTPPCKRLFEMPKIPRRITRTYRAKRRNGHYLTPTFGGTPVKNPNVNSFYSRKEVPLHKVRRKLSFGRKPPTERNATSETMAVDKPPIPEVHGNDKPPTSEIHGNEKPTETSVDDGNQAVTELTDEESQDLPRAKRSKKMTNKTARELRYLSELSDMLPTRLRSSTKFCSESHMQDFTFHGWRG